MAVAAPALRELLSRGRRRALHLELRDFYGGSAAYAAWLDGREHDRSAGDAEWARLLAPLVDAGADLRRARVVSEPVTSYIRFEHEVTPVSNLAAGERVRWLPRCKASDLALPGNDFWIIDNELLFTCFSGDGLPVHREVTIDPALIDFCVTAFESVWSRATEHADYKPA